MALEGTGFELSLLPVSSLRPHERTVNTHVDNIVAELRRDGVQKDPIIVDSKTRTVLDGMHRLAAFLKLGYANAVCCKVDYDSENVRLRRWARTYAFDGKDELDSLMRSYGRIKIVSLGEGRSMMDTLEAGLVVISGKTAGLAELRSLEEAFEMVDDFDAQAERRGWKRKFVPEDEILAELSRSDNLVLLVQRLSKDDVVRTARSGSLFPCKTSMHIVDPRPVDVRFPLDKLDSPDGPALLEKIAKGPHRILPPGSLYEGRRYKERLLLLNQSD